VGKEILMESYPDHIDKCFELLVHSALSQMSVKKLDSEINP